MIPIEIIAIFLLMAVSYPVVLGAAPDKHDNCELWANSGECENNPGYMLDNCGTSCERLGAQALKDAEELAKINSFFDLSAKDIHGDVIEFSKFEGDVTIIANVASYCGYTDSHYKGVSTEK